MVVVAVDVVQDGSLLADLVEEVFLVAVHLLVVSMLVQVVLDIQHLLVKHTVVEVVEPLDMLVVIQAQMAQ
jgi:hypothetical protein